MPPGAPTGTGPSWRTRTAITSSLICHSIRCDWRIKDLNSSADGDLRPPMATSTSCLMAAVIAVLLRARACVTLSICRDRGSVWGSGWGGGAWRGGDTILSRFSWGALSTAALIALVRCGDSTSVCEERGEEINVADHGKVTFSYSPGMTLPSLSRAGTSCPLTFTGFPATRQAYGRHAGRQAAGRHARTHAITITHARPHTFADEVSKLS